ncbi:hypothetical protein L484_025805 [Morus notabilis]|uniref:DUF761 domain-containing protein n=1 Tax=Morus notabilis TaxID=981085 RepID=W9R452_9ROSA|nr:hypothetical protein L484_025805 [Morus notabilis]
MKKSTINNVPNDEREGGHQFFREKRDTSCSSDIVAVENKKSETTSNKKLESKPSMDINESAEAFIKNFRQQLLIQRLDSIENYQKMIARGL